MFTPKQFRSKATEYGELGKDAPSSDQRQKFQRLEQSFNVLADNEQWLADNHQRTVHAADAKPTGVKLAAEEEHVLRCLGAALILQWNTLPTKLRRELFDNAGAMGELLETPGLRAQIARFLHKHKDDAGRDKTLEARQDARSRAAALSRWDNEGGAVPDGLPM